MDKAERLKKHRLDIMNALGVPEEIQLKMVPATATDQDLDYFMGTFSGPQWQYLDSQGLINRGYCPLCGQDEIGTSHFRTNVYSRVKEFLCEDCYKRTDVGNPNLMEAKYPGFKRRYYTWKLIKWVFIALALYTLVKLVT